MLSRKGTRKLEIVTWEDVRYQVAAVNKQFADVISKINPKKSYKLVKVTYNYGDLVINNGLVQLPTDQGGLQSVDQSDLPPEIKKQLSYQKIPLFLTLKNDNEVFLDTGHRIVPLNLFHQGSLLGVFETIDYIHHRPSAAKWCVSAGARSIFMLPRITDNVGLDRLKLRYAVPTNMHLRFLQDHWPFFTSMVNHENFEQSWENEILFFTEDWITADGLNWAKFKEYIYEQGWEQAQFSIGKVEAGLQWETFAEAISMRNLKPRLYLADQIKHILSIATSKSPAFRPIDDTQQSAPIRGIQNAFLDTYFLKDYVPTMMGICPLKDISNGLPVYYSLSLPTLLEGTPVDKSTSTIMLDMRKIKLLIETMSRYVKGKTAFEGGLIHSIDIGYFHSVHDKRGEIENSSRIFLEDNSFEKDKKLFADRKLCDTSPFWRGCIRIRVKVQAEG